MTKTDTTTTPSVNEDYVTLYVWAYRMAKKIEGAFGEDTEVNLPDEFFDVLFDNLGVPKDNTANFPHPTHEHPSYPEGCHCRDWAYWLFGELVDDENNSAQDIICRFQNEVAQ